MLPSSPTLERTIAKYIYRKKGTGPPNWYQFSAYDILSNRSDSELIQAALENMVRPVLDQVDVFIPLIRSGIAISTWLHSTFRKPLLFVEDSTDTARQQLGSPSPERLCLVDTSVNTKSTFRRAVSAMQKHHLSPDRMIVIVYNDLWLEPDPLLSNILAAGKFHSICTTSVLVSMGLIPPPSPWA
jgi:hypothetical protein